MVDVSAEKVVVSPTYIDVENFEISQRTSRHNRLCHPPPLGRLTRKRCSWTRQRWAILVAQQPSLYMHDGTPLHTPPLLLLVAPVRTFVCAQPRTLPLSTSDVKKPAAQLTASQHITAGYFHSVTIYVLLSWTVPGFQAVGPDQTLCMVCLARNIKISVRWIPSEFNSTDRGSREHDNAHDATNSVVDHLGSRDGQALAGAHTGSGRDHSHCEAETLATSDGVPFDGDLLPGTLKLSQKKRRDSVRLEVGGDSTE